MKHDLPPPDEALDLILKAAQQCSVATTLPREAVLDVCPVCSKAIIIRHGHAVCESGMCRGRILEGCCGE